MKIRNLTFDIWKANHSPDHDDKWCRELYPFHVFSKIDFDDGKIDIEQRVYINKIHYFAILRKIEMQETKKYLTTFELYTSPISESQAWKHRRWNTTFQIVYSKEFDFVTVFTKKKDPSKDYVVRFMKGNFQKLSENKSLPVSELLFRTLLLQLAEENFPNGIHHQLFNFDLMGVRKLPEHPQFKRNKLDFAPIYSIGRDLWICYSFTEEKAHRIAYFIANQCKKLIVVYCNPSYTKHHRCTYENVFVFSLYEFANSISSMIRNKYEFQIRFLQNHLRPIQAYNSTQLLEEINSPRNEVYEIKKSDLMEAFGVMKIIPFTNLDFFHSITSINLINAFLSQKRKKKTLKSKEMNLFRNMYYFKTYLSNILTDRIVKEDFSIPIFIQGELIIVEIFDFQFSFHNVPMNETLDKYELSIYNKEINWTGKRLQPIAPLLFYYSRLLRQEEIKKL